MFLHMLAIAAAALAFLATCKIATRLGRLIMRGIDELFDILERKF